MGRQERKVYLFISDENKLFYTANQDTSGGWAILKSAQPTPIRFNPSNLFSSQIEFATNKKYFSLNRSISYPLDFIKDGAAILRQLYFLGKGIEQKVYLTVVEWDGNLGYYVLSYKGKFDFGQKKEDPKSGMFSVSLVDDSAWGILSLNDTVKYDINCSATNPKAIKVVVDGITLNNVFTFQTVNSYMSTSSIGAYQTIPFVLVNQDGDSAGLLTKSQTSFVFDTNTRALLEAIQDSAAFLMTSVYGVTGVKIQGTLTFQWSSNRPIADGVEFFFYTTLGQKRQVFIALGGVGFGGHLIAGKIYSIDFDFTIDLAASEKLFFIATLSGSWLNNFRVTPQVKNTKISVQSKAEAQIVYGLRPLDLLQEIVRKATYGRYTIHSNYFTENNKVVVTSGDAIRGVPNSSIYTSFEDWFKTFDAIDWIALRVIDGELWVEPVTEVYKTGTTLFDLGDAIDLQLEPATDMFCNEIEVGSPDQDYRHPSGRLEVNAKNTFSLPFWTVNKKMEVMTTYRTGCYDIQFLILDYQGQSTRDNNGDKSGYCLDITDEVTTVQTDVETFVNVDIDDAPLEPIITSPFTNDVISYNKPTIKGIAPAGSNVNIYVDNALDGNTTADINGKWIYEISGALTTYEPGVHTGIHIIDATYTDELAPKSTVTITIDTSVPTDTLIIYPQNGDNLYNNKPLIKGVSQAGNNVAITINGISHGTVLTDNSCKWEFQSPVLPNGATIIIADTQTETVNIDSFVDYPLITSFIDGFPIINNMPLVEGVAKPGTIVDLWFNYITYQKLGTTIADANGNWSIQVIPITYPDPYNPSLPIILSPLPNGLAIFSTFLVNHSVKLGITGFKLNRPAYSSITGVVDNTVFNTTLSPKRMLNKRAPLLASIMSKLDGESILFQTASKNANQVTVLGTEVISERADIQLSSLGNPLAVLEYAILKTNVPRTFNEILYNFNQGGLIKANFRGTDIFMLPIGNMKMANITDEAQEWKLLIHTSTSYQSLLNLYKNGLIITLMKNSLYHSDYNSLHMVTYDFVQPAKYNNKSIYDDWFNNRNYGWLLNPKYIQKYQTTETLVDQIIVNGISGINLLMFRCSDAKLVATIPYVAATPVPIPLPDIVLQATVDLSLFPEGQYFFVIDVEGLHISISERIQTKANWAKTILIESTNSINSPGAFYSTGFKSIYRVEGMIQKLQPNMTTISSRDEIGDTEMLYSILAKKRVVRFGDAYGLPDYLYMKIANALGNDTLLIEGVAYTLNKDEKIEPADDVNGHPLFYYNVNLDLQTNSKGKTYPGQAGADTSGAVLVIDAIAFGLPAGSFINIDVVND